MRSVCVGIDLRELCAKKENLRGIVDSDNQDDDGPRGSIGLAEVAFAEI